MSDFEERQWERTARATKARSNAVREPIRRAVQKARREALDGVAFASQTARDLAITASLAWPHFKGVESKSAKGYNASEVRSIIAALDGEEDMTDG